MAAFGLCRNFLIVDYRVVAADGDKRLVANCGGYSSNRKGEDSFAENLANAEFIATAWNVLRQLNPTNPLAAANALPGVVAALEGIIAVIDESNDVPFCECVGGTGYQCHVCDAREALAALKGETDGN